MKLRKRNNGILGPHIAVQLQANIRWCRLGLRPRLDAGPVCDA